MDETHSQLEEEREKERILRLEENKTLASFLPKGWEKGELKGNFLYFISIFCVVFGKGAESLLHYYFVGGRRPPRSRMIFDRMSFPSLFQTTKATGIDPVGLLINIFIKTLFQDSCTGLFVKGFVQIFC